MKERRIRRHLRYSLVETVEAKSIKNAGDIKDTLNVLRENIPFLREFNIGPTIQQSRDGGFTLSWRKSKWMEYKGQLPMLFNVFADYIVKKEENDIRRVFSIRPMLYLRHPNKGNIDDTNREMKEKYERTIEMDDNEQEFFNEINKTLFELFEEYDPASQ